MAEILRDLWGLHETHSFALVSLSVSPGSGQYQQDLVTNDEMLRAYASGEEASGAPARRSDWIGALTDPRPGAALDAIHAAPDHNWTLHELAGIAGMSRSAFAEAFKRALGRAPIDYVAHWRMQVAEDLLARGHSVTEVATRVGYSAPSAFAAAYKRIRELSPGTITRKAEAKS